MFSALIFAAALQTLVIDDSVPHDSQRYTQGLSFDGKTLIESAGLYGKSGLYRMPSAGVKAKDSVKLGSAYFGEGSVRVYDDIVWLTWKEGVAFVYDAKTLAPKSSFPLPTQGWGLTLWNGEMLMSDGSDELLVLSPADHRVIKTIPVKDGRTPVANLNELEAVGNTLYANVWGSDSIAVIDLPQGNVRAWINLSPRAKALRKRFPKAEVLNGIAWDGKNLWITGKLWPVMYRAHIKK